MGGWVSSIVGFAITLYPRPSPLSLAYPRPTQPEDLLSAAVEIVARRRRQENMSDSDSPGPSSRTARDNRTLHSEDSDDCSSESDCPENSGIVGIGQRRTIRGCFQVGDKQPVESGVLLVENKMGFLDYDNVSRDGAVTPSGYHESGLPHHRGWSYSSLCVDTRIRCGLGFDTHCPGKPSASSTRLTLRRRELGGDVRTAPPICTGTKCAITNRFAPNVRRVVDRLRTKTFCSQFVDGGERIMTASQDEKIRFMVRSGADRFVLERVVEVPQQGWSILDVVASKDGRSLVYGTWTDSVFVGRLSFNPKEPVEWSRIPVADDPANAYRMALFSMRFSHSGGEVLCGGSDRRIHVIDLQAGKKILSINAHDDDVNAVSYGNGDSDSHLLYSGGDDGLCRVWDRRAICEDEKPVGVFAGHRDGITYIDPRGDDRFLLSNSKDQTIKIWDLRKFSSDEAMDATRHSVASQQWDYRWQCVPNPAAIPPMLRGDTSVCTLRGHRVLHTLLRARFSPASTGRRYVATGCATGCAVVYDILTGEQVNRLAPHEAVVRDVNWHPDGTEMLTSSWDGSTWLWRWDERKATRDREDELSTDEYFQPIQHKRKRARRKRV